MSYTNSSVLFGRDRHLTRQFLILAAIIFFASLVVYTSFPAYEGLPLTFVVVVPSIPIIAGTVALVSAYLNDGLLVSALVPVMAVLGLELSLGIWLYFDLVPSYNPAGFDGGVRAGRGLGPTKVPQDDRVLKDVVAM